MLWHSKTSPPHRFDIFRLLPRSPIEQKSSKQNDMPGSNSHDACCPSQVLVPSHTFRRSSPQKESANAREKTRFGTSRRRRKPMPGSVEGVSSIRRWPHSKATNLPADGMTWARPVTLVRKSWHTRGATIPSYRNGYNKREQETRWVTMNSRGLMGLPFYIPTSFA